MTAPQTSPRALLDEKRRDLSAAEEQLAAAHAAMDVEGTLAAEQRIAVLRQFITRLEAAAVTELEAEGRERAEAWLAAQPKQSAARAKAMTVAQTEAQRLLGEALAAMQDEARLRREHVKVISGVRVLTARFPALVAPTLKSPPSPLDHAFEVLREANKVIDAANTPPVRLSPNVTANMDEAQRRRAVLQAIAALMDRKRSVVPPEVSEILTATPIPADVLAVKPQPEMSERERRAMEAMAQEVRATQAALALVDGSNRLGRGM